MIRSHKLHLADTIEGETIEVTVGTILTNIIDLAWQV